MKAHTSATSQSGATLVEMLAGVIILSVVVLGVLQFLLVSRLNVYTANIQTGVIQLLSDTMVAYQFVEPGTSTNIPVSGEWASYISSSTPYVAIQKAATPVNGTYTLSGSVTWRAFPNGDGSDFKYTKTLNLQIPQ